MKGDTSLHVMYWQKFKNLKMVEMWARRISGTCLWNLSLEKIMILPSNLDMNQHYDLVILLLIIYYMEAIFMCTRRMFIVTLFIVTKNWKAPLVY